MCPNGVGLSDEDLVPYQLASSNVAAILNSYCLPKFKFHVGARERPKDVNRIEAKTASGTPLEQIYDIGGVRLLLHYLKEIDQVKDFIFGTHALWKLHHSGSAFVNAVEREGEIWKPHFKDYRAEPRGKVGYRSLHIVVYYRLLGYRNKYFPCEVQEIDKDKFPVEIQLRTYLLHSWEEKEHALYADELKSEFLSGQFYTIAQLLWHLDSEFQVLRDRIDDMLKESRQETRKGDS